jgi:hypothetical protein
MPDLVMHDTYFVWSWALNATLGHADLKTTSVYAHARPGESSGRYLKTK